MPSPTQPSAPSPSHPSVKTPALRIPARIESLPTLSDYIETVGEENALSGADLMAFNLAAEELLANTVRHGSPQATAIEFSLTVHNGFATAIYADDAGPFDPTAAPEADTSLPQERRAIGGLGIHFIRRTMQVFSWRREGDRNVIAFGRALSHATVPPPV